MSASRFPGFWFFSFSTREQELTGKSVLQAPIPSIASRRRTSVFLRRRTVFLRRRTGGVVRLAAGAVFVLTVGAAIVLSGCGDRSRRLSGVETLNYKRQLITSHRDEVSPQQMEEFLYRPERTEESIDAVFEEYRVQFAKQKAVDRAPFEAERRAPVPSRGG
jgi:hypothetical protein